MCYPNVAIFLSYYPHFLNFFTTFISTEQDRTMKLIQLKHTSGQTKLQQLIESIGEAIAHQQFKAGEALPSVNDLSRDLKFSRDTVFKAYKELIRRGLVESAPTKGYYVNNPVNKVFLLLDSYSPYKDVLYNAIVENLPANFKVDLAFHHYNYRVFETLIQDSIGKYNVYVIMNYDSGPIADILSRLDSNKLLMLDWGNYEDSSYSYVCQNFGESAFDCLLKARHLLKKYRSFNLMLPDEAEHPKVVIDYFRKFCKAEGLTHSVTNRFEVSDIQEGQAWFVFRQKDLIQLVKYCKTQGLIPGKQVGILAYNDAPLYEIIETGITSISTDFAQMGYQVAQFIITRNKTKTVVPTNLIVRGSL